MGFRDWNWIGQTQYFQQSSQRSDGNEHSLLIEGKRSESEKNMAVLEQSVEDSPTEAQLVTSFYGLYEDHLSSFGMVLRWQDESNFYAIHGSKLLSERGGDIDLYKEKDGTGETIRSVNQRNSVPNQDEWYQFRCTAFLSDRGLHFRPEFRQSEVEEWTRYNPNSDLIDPNPDLQSGGGVGMVFYNPPGSDGNSQDTYLDNTKVYYRSN